MALAEFRAAVVVLFAGLERPMAWRLLFATTLALSSGALVGLAPIALKELIDAASGARSGARPAPAGAITFLGLGMVYLLILAAARLIAEFRPFLIGAVEQRLYAHLRSRYFSHVLDLPLSFHLNGQTGALNQHLQQAITGYQVILSCLLNGLAPVLVEALTVAVVLVSLGQPLLALNLAATALALWWIVGQHVPPLRSTASAISDATTSTSGLLADSLVNVEPIKCFGGEDRALTRFRGLCSTLEHRWGELQSRRLKMGAAVTGVFSLSVASSLAIAIHGLSHGTLSLGGFVLATLYMVQIIRPLELLSSAARDVSQGLAFVRPLLDVLATPTDAGRHRRPSELTSQHVEDNGRGYRMRQEPPRATPGAAVSFHGVHLSFERGTPVLYDLNLDIPAGRSLALVGASGCGKSSIVRLLLRLCEPDSGRICLDGVRVDAVPVQALRARIAVVPQDVALMNSTIGANIALGRDGAPPASIVKAARLAGLHDFVATLPLGYETVIGERGLKLSGGERQRIAIARAILRDPQLYVLDEATSMLDPGTERAIMTRLKEASEGRTVLMIAHRLSAIQHTDEIAVLACGRITERGDHATLLALGGAYATMWHHQQRIHASGPVPEPTASTAQAELETATGVAPEPATQLPATRSRGWPDGSWPGAPRQHASAAPTCPNEPNDSG